MNDGLVLKQSNYGLARVDTDENSVCVI